MKYYRLLTALPALPEQPVSTSHDLEAAIAMILDEVSEADRRACALVLQLYRSRGEPAAPMPSDEEISARLSAQSAEANKYGGRFLQDLMRFEISLRETLARKRAATLGRALPPPIADDDHAQRMASLDEAPDPGRKTLQLDADRMRTIAALSAHAPFSLDEVLAYLANARILGRWKHSAFKKPTRLWEVMT